ncbi:MAG TPA: ABC transporter permease subunit [Candidatus Sulfotelmatobacter sp.]|jgi:NitT/TauT family transport system permease protein|nr:ABC transporter permease subunit [Candidatus Sulfotelmatobacter sp.]
MSSSSATIDQTPELVSGVDKPQAANRIWVGGLVAAAAWAAAAFVTGFIPDDDDWGYSLQLAHLLAAAAVVLTLSGLFLPRLPVLYGRVRAKAAWLVVLALGLAVWELVTAKLGWLPRPFFVPPQALLEVYADEWRKLAECTYHSVLLLGSGYLLGAFAGFSVGVAVGWSRIAAYWGHPLLRFIGPLPATAWLPIAFFIFPSSWSASVFLIALATAIPVAILTWSGVSAVGSAYYDIARTLGASQRFLVLKVAVPASLPSVFVGLFMGMSASFAVLVVAEMMGVKAGLGWYLSWAQGWAAYANMYAALVVMALMCSSLVALLFRVRDHVLAWQKGLLRW